MPLKAVDYDTHNYRPQTDRGSARPVQFALTQKDSPSRSCIEQFIANKYLEIHDAHLNHFLPLLLSVSSNESFME